MELGAGFHGDAVLLGQLASGGTEVGIHQLHDLSQLRERIRKKNSSTQ